MFALTLLRSKRSRPGRSDYGSVAVRLAGPADEHAIRRVAALDSRKAPSGRVLVAEADGEIVAALSVEDGSAVADPFRWTSDIVALMELRAGQLVEADVVAGAATAAVGQLRTQTA